MTAVYALVHMAVDLSCAFLVFAYVSGGDQWYLWLLIYNFCAFALQMPIGAAADRLDRNSCVAAGGCAGVLAGLLLGSAGFPAAAAVLAGIGNACFHVGGGIDVPKRGESGASGDFCGSRCSGNFSGNHAWPGRKGAGGLAWRASDPVCGCDPFDGGKREAMDLIRECTGFLCGAVGQNGTGCRLFSGGCDSSVVFRYGAELSVERDAGGKRFYSGRSSSTGKDGRWCPGG